MNAFVVVVVVVTLVGPNGEPFVSAKVEGVKGEVVVAGGVPKATAVLVAPNGVLDELVTVVPKVSPVVPVAIPNVGLAKAVVLVVSNCEVAVAKGLAVVDGVAPKGEALDVGRAAAVV